MSESGNDLLREAVRLATDLGPALKPVGHQELVASITATAREVFRAHGCSIALLDPARENLVFYVASSGSDPLVGQKVPVGQGIAGWVVASGQPIAVSNVATDPRFARDMAEQTGYVPSTILAMPLETERELIGVMEILDPGQGDSNQARDLELLGLFARQAALAIEASQVFADLGHALFSALAGASEDSDLTASLRATAEAGDEPTAGLARLAACFNELSRISLEERDTATGVLEVLLARARQR